MGRLCAPGVALLGLIFLGAISGNPGRGAAPAAVRAACSGTCSRPALRLRGLRGGGPPEQLEDAAGILVEKEDEVVKIMMQALEGMGLLETARCLERESGISLRDGQAESVLELERAVLDGRWEDACGILEGASSSWGTCRARFPVYRQMYLELLEEGHRAAAERYPLHATGDGGPPCSSHP